MAHKINPKQVTTSHGVVDCVAICLHTLQENY